MHPTGGIKFDELGKPDVGSAWQRYGQSKLGNILLAKGMAHHHPQIISLAVHPGLVKTGLTGATEPGALKWLFNFAAWARIPIYKTADQGAENTLWAVSVKREEVENGAYHVPVGQRTQSAQAKAVEDEALRDKFWAWLEKELEDLAPL